MIIKGILATNKNTKDVLSLCSYQFAKNWYLT